MKHCIYCQRELDDRQQVCPYCGEQQEPLSQHYHRPEEPVEEAQIERLNPSSDRTRAVISGIGMGVLGYFDYLRSKWSGRNVMATSAIMSLVTLFLYSFFTSLLANIVARGNFLSFLQYLLIIAVFALLCGLVSFLSAKLIGKDTSGILEYYMEFFNFLSLPMVLSLIGVIVGLVKAHNVAQIILFTSLFLVFPGIVAKLTQRDESTSPSLYPALLIASTCFVGFLLVLTKLLF